MKRKLFRGMTSAALTGAMVLSMSGMSALAAVTPIPFTKTVTTDGDTYAPDTTFEFEIKSAEADSLEDTEGGTITTIEGPEGGLIWTDDDGAGDNTIIFTPATGAAQDSYSNSSHLYVELSAFDKPGVYHYTLEENKGQYPGITYSEEVYHIYVAILADLGEDKPVGSMMVGSITTTITDEEGVLTKNGDIVFTNDYGYENNLTHDVTITKLVTGNQAEYGRSFDFNFTITADGGSELFKYVVKTAAGVETVLEYDGTEASISLANGDSVTIYGLTEGDLVNIHETNEYENDGYTVTRSDINEEEITLVGEDDADNRGIIANIKADEASVTIENNKNVGAATGVALTFGPYALMVVLAGALGAMFLRKKKGYDEI